MRTAPSLALLALAAAPSLAAQGTPIRVTTLDVSRYEACGGLDRHFGGPYYDSARAALTSPGNFGAGAPVGRPVQLQEVARFDEATLAATDVVLFLGGRPVPDPDEFMLLNSFVLAGGGLMVSANSAATVVADMVGASEAGNGRSGTPRISNASSPMVNGPFGIAGAVGTGLSRGFGGSFLALGPHGVEAVALGGESFAGTFTHGAGRIAAICDEEVITSRTLSGCAVAAHTGPNPTLFLNSIAWVTPAPGFAFGAGDVVTSAYGAACAPGALFEPALTALGDPSVGGRLTFRIARGADMSPGVLLFGTAPAQVPLLGCQVLVGSVVASPSLTLAPLPNGGNGILLPFTVPVGVSGSLRAQAWLLDASASSGLTTTAGAEVAF